MLPLLLVALYWAYFNRLGVFCEVVRVRGPQETADE